MIINSVIIYVIQDNTDNILYNSYNIRDRKKSISYEKYRGDFNRRPQSDSKQTEVH